jgi:hypothetical protein
MTPHPLFAAEAAPTVAPGFVGAASAANVELKKYGENGTTVGAASAAKSISHCYDQILLIYSRIFMINKSISWH